jgi:hypothetical protein
LCGEFHNEVRNGGSRFRLVECVSVSLKRGPRFVEDVSKHGQRLGIEAIGVLSERGHNTLGAIGLIVVNRRLGYIFNMEWAARLMHVVEKSFQR